MLQIQLVACATLAAQPFWAPAHTVTGREPNVFLRDGYVLHILFLFFTPRRVSSLFHTTCAELFFSQSYCRYPNLKGEIATLFNKTLEAESILTLWDGSKRKPFSSFLSFLHHITATTYRLQKINSVFHPFLYLPIPFFLPRFHVYFWCLWLVDAICGGQALHLSTWWVRVFASEYLNTPQFFFFPLLYCIGSLSSLCSCLTHLLHSFDSSWCRIGC